MMAASSISPTSFNASLGQTQFLQLMVAQLQYQDPTNPVQQQDMLGQLAQFSVLDGVDKLNANFDDLIRLESLSQGTGLVGHNVQYADSTSGAQQTGVVNSAKIVDNNLILSINNQDVPIAQVLAVLANAPAA